VAILAALASGLASLCVTHLRLSTRADNALHATNLARSAIAAGIARVAETPEFGTPDGPPEPTISISTSMGRGFLSFSRSAAEAEDVPYSTNNIGNTSTTEGATGSVGPDTVHLVARGVCNGVERKIEALVKVPSYPWAVAATGKLEIVSGATVGALPAGVWPPSENQLEPADLISNSSDGDSILLGGTSRILGNVETPGGVIISGAGVTVEGQVREGAEPTDIPSLDPVSYDPQRRGLAFDDLDGLTGDTVAAATTSASVPVDPDGPQLEELLGGDAPPEGGGAAPTLAPTRTTGLVLTGAARRDGDLNLDQGLKLDAASLYVDGNLTVNGPIEGYGVLVVTGDITINTGVVLQGATQLAVLSGGQVTLRGTGPGSTVVRGIFYAKNGVSARQMTVIGTLIAGGENASILLDDVSVYNQEALEGGGSSSVGPAGPGGRTSSGREDPWLTITSTRLTGDDWGTGPTSAPPAASTNEGSATATTAAGGPSSFISMRERMKVVSWFEN
jgi:cytoskeletal protein CcmA (bactofilin family)